MPKTRCEIGFGYDREIRPGVYDLEIVERVYYADIVRDTLEVASGGQVLGDLYTANAFSVVADAYAEMNFFNMKYIFWNGRPWYIKQVEVQAKPRLLIRIGGVWNGPRASRDAT